MPVTARDAQSGAVAVGADPDRFLGRGQVVELVVDECPELIQHTAFGVGVVAVVEAVLNLTTLTVTRAFLREARRRLRGHFS